MVEVLQTGHSLGLSSDPCIKPQLMHSYRFTIFPGFVFGFDEPFVLLPSRRRH